MSLRLSDVEKIIIIESLPKEYCSLLHILGKMPIMSLLMYKEMMLYHNVTNSDDERVAKQLINEQEKYG